MKALEDPDWLLYVGNCTIASIDMNFLRPFQESRFLISVLVSTGDSHLRL